MTSDSGPITGSLRPGSSGSIAFISPASRASGAKARRISTRLTDSSTASPPASAITRPFAGWIINTMPAPSNTAALGTNNRQNSGMNGDPDLVVDDRTVVEPSGRWWPQASPMVGGSHRSRGAPGAH